MLLPPKMPLPATVGMRLEISAMSMTETSGLSWIAKRFHFHTLVASLANRTTGSAQGARSTDCASRDRRSVGRASRSAASGSGFVA
jgi:hypothetical protein